MAGRVCYTFTPMPTPLIDHHRQFCAQQAVFIERPEAVHPASHWLHCDIAAHAGHGWMDVGSIPHGLNIGRSHYALNAPWQCHYNDPNHAGISLYLLLSGRAKVAVNGHSQLLTGGALYLCDHTRTADTITFRQAATTPFHGITCTLPPALLAELAADAPAPIPRPQRPGYIPLPRQTPAHLQMMQLARRMLETATHTTVGRLHLESQALELAALMAGHLYCCMREPEPRLPHRQQVAVEDALDILEREWMSAHTITALSRRVRLNECYLKTAFRQTTGQTIAQYLRQLRMRHARHLIEDTRASVLQTAAFVGYSNPSHFASAFKAVYGTLPSALKQ